MERNKKREIVEQLKAELGDVTSVFLCNFSGLTVDKDTEMRKSMREAGVSYAVHKNTLLKLAFADTDFAQVNDHLKGNTAIVHGNEDIVGVAKLIRDYAKKNEAFQFKAGVVEGQVIDVAGLDTLAEMPSKEELVSKLMYMMNFPVQGLVTAMSGLSRNLVVVLDQIKQQKEQ